MLRIDFPCLYKQLLGRLAYKKYFSLGRDVRNQFNCWHHIAIKMMFERFWYINCHDRCEQLIHLDLLFFKLKPKRWAALAQERFYLKWKSNFPCKRWSSHQRYTSLR